MSEIQTLLSQRQLPPLPQTRQEMLNILAHEEYGPLPPAPRGVSAEIIGKPEMKCAGHAVYVEYLLTADMGDFEVSFPVRCILPRSMTPAAKTPAAPGSIPAFVFINFRPAVPDWYLPAEEIIDRGFAVFSLYYNEISDDKADGFTTGIAPEMVRAFGPTSKISLWAWACSRVMDWISTRKELDPSRIAVVGHSRLGKTALWAGANDERFACTISNDSGCSGAALTRDKDGETVKIITTNFPHWSVDAYKLYRDKEHEMPFDQHYLLAAVAPRKLYVASAEEDTWADPVSEYLSCCAASAAWEEAGLPGFIHPDRLPEIDDCFREGSVGYHLREGAHCLSRYDWNRFMDFMEKTK